MKNSSNEIIPYVSHAYAGNINLVSSINGSTGCLNKHVEA